MSQIQNIIEADAVAFYVAQKNEVRARLAPLCKKAGYEPAELNFNHFSEPVHITAWHGTNSVNGVGNTIAEAEAKFVAAIKAKTPDSQKLRAEAERLLAQAAKLEAANA